MQVVSDLLARHGLNGPDGRLLHGYELLAEEYSRLTSLLHTRVVAGAVTDLTGAGFVLWASERIRTCYAGGPLTWDFVFQGLGAPYQWAVASELTQRGLQFWCRPLRQAEDGRREFLYTLLAEGGLPDLALAEGGGLARYRAALLGLIARIEAEGALGPTIAETAAFQVVQGLPHALRTGDQSRLMADLARGLVSLRQIVPEDLPEGAVLAWLDAQRPDWRSSLPLRLSQAALEALVRPALLAAPGRPEVAAPPVVRQLRRREGGAGWAPVVVLAESARLRAELMPAGAAGLVLRLVTEAGQTFRVTPNGNALDMVRTGGRGPLALALDPHRALVLGAFADGRSLGEVVLDAGLPAASEAPSLWRAQDPAAAEPEVLVPLSGRGKTRAAQLFALVADDVVPQPGAGVTCGDPLPGPGGRLWPLSGQGDVQIGDLRLRLETGADADSPAALMVATHARNLVGLAQRNGAPVFLATPAILGAEGDQPLMALGNRARWRDQRGVLGGKVVEWIADGAVLSRMRLVILPPTAEVLLHEVGAAQLGVKARGLSAGWHLHLKAGESKTQAAVHSDGTLELNLSCTDLPGEVGLRLTDPVAGTALDLVAPWPARSAILVDPDGRRLTANREISARRLSGWRGVFPPTGGVVQLRLAGDGAPVAFPAGGNERLAGHGTLIEQALALKGDADGRVNLRLVSGGTQTHRLEIGRHDWQALTNGPHGPSGLEGTALRAVCLDDPVRRAEAVATGAVDLLRWLGEDDGLWYVQGLHPQRGVMRPFVWSARPRPHSTRDERIDTYKTEWLRLLASPTDPGWARAWELIVALRAAGDASGLDQIAALGRVPAAAAALVLTVLRADRAAALALESEVPLWWPLVPCRDWITALAVARDRLAARLAEAGFPAAEAERLLGEQLARTAGEIIVLRPELAAHLGRAIAAVGIREQSLTQWGLDALRPVPGGAARTMLILDAQDAARRFERLPEGANGLSARFLRVDHPYADAIQPLLQAPLVVAEVAAGLRQRPSAPEILQLLALRAAESIWFDRALPSAVTLALEGQA